MTSSESKIIELSGENLVMLAEYHTGDEKRLIGVCKILDLDKLQKLKKGKVHLLLFTEEEIVRGADVFPVEFLNIKHDYTIHHGKDLLKNITILKKNLRSQLEFEFRSKLIHLRSEYLLFREKELASLILSAIPALAPIMGGLVYLKDLKHGNTRDMFDIVSNGYGIDVSVLKEIYDIRQGKAEFKKDKEQYIRELITVLSGIGNVIDELKVNE